MSPLLKLAEAPLQQPTLGSGGYQVEGGQVGVPRLVVAAEAEQEVRLGRRQQVVVVQGGRIQCVKGRQAGCSAVAEADGDGPVQGDDG
jgi:hypothetical protein